MPKTLPLSIHYRMLGWPCYLAAIGLAALLAVAVVQGTLAQESAAPPDDEAATERNIERMQEPWLRLNTAGHTGTVQALAFLPDSRRLCSGGLDKVVQVWDVSAIREAQGRNLKRDTLRERTIRWQVARGPRGSIYAVAAAPVGDLLAIGGYGAMGSTGEILLVDPLDGKLIRVLEGHRQTVCSLAFSSDGGTLISVDVAGETRLWRKADWTSTVLYQNDAKTYGPDRAARIAALPLIRPAVALGNARLIVPVLVTSAGNELGWKLQEIGLSAPRTVRTFATSHRGLVTALAATPDGRRLASADLRGNVYLWDLSTGAAPTRLATKFVGRSLAFSPDGRQLVVGGAVDTSTQKSELQIWDVATQQILAQRALVDHVHACAVSPDGQRLAYVGGPRNEIFLENLTTPNARAQTLRGWQRKIFKVAFAQRGEPYRVAYGATFRDQGFNNYGDLTEIYDPATGELTQGNEIDLGEWNVSQPRHGAWQVRLEDQGYRLVLLEGNTPRGTIQLDRQSQGHVRSYCWIPGANDRPQALAIGTDTQNGVFVFGVVDRGPCPLWRQFRGHQDYVTSVAVSRDRRYLVSGAADGTLQFWSLADYQDGLKSAGRWGATFKIRGDELVVDTINSAGPLYRRGVRKDDVISKIGWADAGPDPASVADQKHDATAAQQILARLGDLPAETQVFFEYARGNRQPKSFQLISAWQAVATLFASEEGEWAYWTPEGYYDASTNGHTLFGWQVNQGLYRLPEFFRADQFRKTLERPPVMRELLSAGTLDEAFSRLRAAAPADDEQVLVQQIAAAPRVEILSPRAGDVLADQAAKVRARVRIPADGQILQSRVFANGVGSAQRQVVEERDDPDSKMHEITYEWDVALPRGPRQMIQVYVGTAAKTAAFEQVVVERAADPAPAARRPKLHLLAVGVGQYVDQGIPSLDYPLSDAKAVVQALERGSGGLYDVVEPVVLTDDQVTRTRWTETFSGFVRNLREDAHPDDLLVIFFAGHGEVDDPTGTYHFICHDASIDKLLDGTATISWNDFELLADIPCRKLALLDTCHSGAIQGVRQAHKLAIREFQENVIFTVAAAAGDEGSFEHKDWGHGAFTKSVLDALSGQADASTDGVVTLDELVTYVNRAVPELARSKGERQHPTAAPRDLLDLVVLPVSQAQKTTLRQPSPTAVPR